MNAKPMASPVIAVDNLHHSFKTLHALRGISFQVHAGSLHGFVGPNGAGKTTALKLICTLLLPQKGQVRVFGHASRGSAAGSASSQIVSPILVSVTFLMLATTHPTSPETSSSHGKGLGVRYPNSSTV